MKLLRCALILLCLALSAQTPEPNDIVSRSHAAYNAFAAAANDWTEKHDDLTWSRADHERLNKARTLWKQFDRLAKEAQF